MELEFEPRRKLDVNLGFGSNCICWAPEGNMKTFFFPDTYYVCNQPTQMIQPSVFLTVNRDYWRMPTLQESTVIWTVHVQINSFRNNRSFVFEKAFRYPKQRAKCWVKTIQSVQCDSSVKSVQYGGVQYKSRTGRETSRGWNSSTVQWSICTVNVSCCQLYSIGCEFIRQ